MDYPLTRAMGAATSAYAVFALANPGHLGKALEAAPARKPAFDVLARTYGVRDLATSALLLSGDARLVRAAAALRVAGDLGDAAILSSHATSSDVRRKVLAVTVSWAALNALAYYLDTRDA